MNKMNLGGEKTKMQMWHKLLNISQTLHCKSHFEVFMCCVVNPIGSAASHLAAHVNGDADDHGGNGYAGDEGDAHRSSNQGPQLPQDLLLAAPRLLPPERAAGWTTTGKTGGIYKCGPKSQRTI